MAAPTVELVSGDLLKQPVDVIVNSWNRNVIPWWLLLPQGVSGAIKRHAGTAPFRALSRVGIMPLGSAVLTSAGRLHFRGIIHVAGINLCWLASEYSIRQSTRNAVQLAEQQGFSSMAIPLIGAGSGGFPAEKARCLILDELAKLDLKSPLLVKVVTFAAEK